MFASRRLAELPAPDAGPARHVSALRQAGARVLDLTGAETEPLAPDWASRSLAHAATLPEAHRAAPPDGVPAFRRAVASWYADRHGVRLDPDTQVLPLAGARQGLFLAAFVACDPGDVALVPDPCAGAGRAGAYFAGAEVVSLPLRPERDFLPDLASVPEPVARRARILYLHYPNNPTGAVAPPAFLAAAAAFARRRGLLLCNDFAYGETCYDGYRPRSVLSLEDGAETALEFMTLSEACGLPGWRLGAAVGAPRAVAALSRLVAQVTGGVAAVAQLAGGAVLPHPARWGFLTARNESYRVRRDVLTAALAEAGLPARRPRATPFLWVQCPDGASSAECTMAVLERLGLALTPGSAFGPAGEGYMRISLQPPTSIIEEAAARIAACGPGGLAGLRPAPEPRVPRRGLPPAHPVPLEVGAAPDPADLLSCL